MTIFSLEMTNFDIMQAFLYEHKPVAGDFPYLHIYH